MAVPSRQTITIGQREYQMGQSVSEDLELKEIKRIVDRERGHCQVFKQSICILLILSVIWMNLLMGSESQASLIGVEKCTAQYYSI